MVKINVKKTTTKKFRPHMKDEEDDGRHAGKRASGVQRRLRIAESPGTGYGAHHQPIENVCLSLTQCQMPYRSSKLNRNFMNHPSVHGTKESF